MAHLLAALAIVALAAPDPAVPGFWDRRDAPDSFTEFIVIVLRVKDISDAEAEIARLCRSSKCEETSRPSWYFTGQGDLRTANERYVSVDVKVSKRLASSLAGLGEVLQFRKSGPRNSLSDGDRGILREKRARLQREIPELQKAIPPMPVTIEVAQAALSDADSRLQTAAKASKTALINIRITDNRVH